MKDKVTTKRANEALKPLIKYVHTNYGAMAEIIRRLNKATKKTWNRKNVEQWLHRDPAKRIQPLFGVGLILVQIGQDFAPKPKPSRK